LAARSCFFREEELAPASEPPESSAQRFRFIRRSVKRSDCGGEERERRNLTWRTKKSDGQFIATKEKDVEFVFRSPKAKKVYLAENLNSWEAESLPMKKYTEGAWEAMLKLLPAVMSIKWLWTMLGRRNHLAP